MMEQIADNLYYGENLPYELKLENEESILEGKNTALAAYLMIYIKFHKQNFCNINQKVLKTRYNLFIKNIFHVELIVVITFATYIEF